MPESQQATLHIETVFKTSLAPMFLINNSGVIIKLNQAVCEQFGWQTGELIGENINLLVSEKDRKTIESYFKEVEFSESPKSQMEARPITGQRKDGRNVLCNVLFDAIELPGKPTPYLLGSLSQVSHNTTTTTTSRSKSRLEYAVESHGDATFITDSDGLIAYTNTALSNLTGYTSNELIGRNPNILKSGLMPQEFYKRFWDTILSGEIFRGKITNRRKDGSLYDAEIMCASIFDDTGNLIGYSSTQRDTTVESHSRQQLVEHSTELELANSRLGEAKRSMDDLVLRLENKNQELAQFSYIASHDLQEPLRKVISFSQLLEMELADQLEGDSADYLEYIVEAAHRMRKLIQDLLSLSRVGNNELHLQPLSIEDCVNQAIFSLQVKIDETNATIEKGNLPDVLGDTTLLTQLFFNLIGNALKFISNESTPTIKITAEQKGDWWILGVQDNGIGIDPQHGQQIFAPFKRLHGRGSYEGSGIGLSICKKSVERHGGEIWVESQTGEGSHFRFSLADISSTHVHTPPTHSLVQPI